MNSHLSIAYVLFLLCSVLHGQPIIDRPIKGESVPIDDSIKLPNQPDFLNLDEPPLLDSRFLAESVNSDQRDRIRVQMQLLAPLDGGGGKPAAHRWLARDLIQRPTRTASEESDLLQHLQHLLRKQPNSVSAHHMLAVTLIRVGNHNDAVPHLAKVSAKNPQYYLLLGSVYEQMKQPNKARLYFKKARDHFRDATKRDAQQVASRIFWARAEIRLKRYDLALKILRDGESLQADKRYGKWIAEAYLAKSHNAIGNRPANYQQAVADLRTAARFAPQNARVFRLFGTIANRDAASRRPIQNAIQQVIHADDESYMARMVLGEIAALESDFSTAVRHFERAYELNPSAPIAANNLAHSLGELNPPQLKRALQISETALKQPNIGSTLTNELLATRGLLLVKAKRWQEALEHLKQVESLAATRQDIRDGLAAIQRAQNIDDQ